MPLENLKGTSGQTIVYENIKQLRDFVNFKTFHIMTHIINTEGFTKLHKADNNL